jgi:hypothetical protein
MQDINTPRKNKISLSDYDYQKDIQNRSLMAQFSALDLEILEEILFSSLNIPIKKLAKNLELQEEELFPTLEKMSKTGLLSFNNEQITVDKEMRKYCESQFVKFDEDFKPDMEFFQGLLKKVPIHVLPTWYAISRTSDNIFESLIEKFLLTPQIYQRYLAELSGTDPIIGGIIHDVYNAPEFRVASRDLLKKYNLKRDQFEEIMLHIEFGLAACLGYVREDDVWVEVVTPFYEWKEYLKFLRDTKPPSIKDHSAIVQNHPEEFAFIQHMAAILTLAKKAPIPLSPDGLPTKGALTTLLNKCSGHDPDPSAYLQRLIHKLSTLKLADTIDHRLYALESANEWLDMRPENRAMYLYRHPLNRPSSKTLPLELFQDKNIRESEKSMQRVLDSGWVDFEEFIKGVFVPINDHPPVMLKQSGKTWKYFLPQYTDEEKALIKTVIFDWLFEIGAVSIGTHQGKDCFAATPFGQSLFGR